VLPARAAVVWGEPRGQVVGRRERLDGAPNSASCEPGPVIGGLAGAPGSAASAQPLAAEVARWARERFRLGRVLVGCGRYLRCEGLFAAHNR